MLDKTRIKLIAYSIITDARLHTYSGNYVIYWNTVAAQEYILLTDEVKKQVTNYLKQMDFVLAIDTYDDYIDLNLALDICPNAEEGE